MNQVREAVIAENVEIPGGTIEQGKGQLLLRTLGRVDASADFNNIVVATKDGDADSHRRHRARRRHLRASHQRRVARRGHRP